VVDVGQAQGSLEHDALGLLLSQPALRLVQLEGIFRHELEDHLGDLLVLVEVVQLYDIGVVHRLEEKRLPHAYFLMGLHNFDGDRFSSSVADGLVD